jgi:hypothetical protein
LHKEEFETSYLPLPHLMPIGTVVAVFQIVVALRMSQKLLLENIEQLNKDGTELGAALSRLRLESMKQSVLIRMNEEADENEALPRTIRGGMSTSISNSTVKKRKDRINIITTLIR